MSYIVGTGIIKGGGVGDIEQINKNMNDIIKIKADLQNVSTSEILEGANLYYTEERVSANADVVDLKTNVEGLYSSIIDTSNYILNTSNVILQSLEILPYEKLSVPLKDLIVEEPILKLDNIFKI